MRISWINKKCFDTVDARCKHEEGLIILTLNLLTTTIVAPPSNASKWQMGFNSAFKGLRLVYLLPIILTILKDCLSNTFIILGYIR